MPGAERSRNAEPDGWRQGESHDKNTENTKCSSRPAYRGRLSPGQCRSDDAAGAHRGKEITGPVGGHTALPGQPGTQHQKEDPPRS